MRVDILTGRDGPLPGEGIGARGLVQSGRRLGDKCRGGHAMQDVPGYEFIRELGRGGMAVVLAGDAEVAEAAGGAQAARSRRGRLRRGRTALHQRGAYARGTAPPQYRHRLRHRPIRTGRLHQHGVPRGWQPGRSPGGRTDPAGEPVDTRATWLGARCGARPGRGPPRHQARQRIVPRPAHARAHRLRHRPPDRRPFPARYPGRPGGRNAELHVAGTDLRTIPSTAAPTSTAWERCGSRC